MQADHMDFEAHLGEAFRRPMDRHEQVDVARPVLAKVAREEQRRALALACGAMVGGAVAMIAVAMTGLLQGLGRLAEVLAAGGAPPLADPSLAGALTWTVALLAAGLVTAATARGALQDF